MDNMREKLVELLREVQYLGGLEEKLADHMIANGVTVQTVLCDNCSNFISVEDWNFCPYCGKWLNTPPKGE